MRYAIPDNVERFIDDAADIMGRQKTVEFGDFMMMECESIASPIEQLFLVGLQAVCDTNCVEMGIGQSFDPHPQRKDDTLVVVPQWRLSNYSIDFAMHQPWGDRMVCVELDGHEFHDRDERQRRYEKKRDRLIASKGYTLLHFTGAEVTPEGVQSPV